MDITTMKGKVIKETEDAKILGYTFNSKGNSERHLEIKEGKIISMMANLGLSIKEANMDRIFVPSLLILYRKCFIPKILYDLIGIPLRKNEWEKLEVINRKVLRNFLNLPDSTPRVGLYNEFGVIPIQYMLYKRTLGMWKRINRDETNEIIKECKREQINSFLPWCFFIYAFLSRDDNNPRRVN